MKQPDDGMWVVFLSTFPPRECGIATFTSDLICSFDQLFSSREETRVVAMDNGALRTYDYPKKVIWQIEEDRPEDYLEAARRINSMPQAKLVSVQHEFGIFGPDYGKNILVFLNEIKKPVAVTFHTVLPSPDDSLKEVVVRIAECVGRVNVMTDSSKALLMQAYGLPESKITVIPHGIHYLPYTDGLEARKSLGLEGKRVLSTFGLLNHGKGIEYAIAAMPKILESQPDAVYLVIGATHPVVLRERGEEYRNQLLAQARRLGVADQVIFYNEYLETPELLRFLQATEIYLSLSQNPDQAVSGTLTYALGAGRPVISTPFAQAKEMITPELGILARFGDSESIAQAAVSLLGDKRRLSDMSKTAYFRTRRMTWPNVALAYMREFIELSPALAKNEQSLPAFNLQHLRRLTDDFGVYQFAVLDEPDPEWGYTLDDNARALIAVSRHHGICKDSDSGRLAETYLQFLERALKAGGGFINYFTGSREAHHSRNQSENLEDAEARALWSLAVAASSDLPKHLKEKAATMFDSQYGRFSKVESPRAAAFHIKALASRLSEDDGEASRMISRHADFLLDRFNDNAAPDWQWFEQYLTYSNAVLPEAMILAYKATGNQAYLQAGKASLDFLLSQSFRGAVCEPVGQSGWFKRGEEKKVYDQQPEEVSSLVLALRTMFDLDGSDIYKKRMVQAFHWFLGNNTLNQMVYSQTTGGCYDGLGEGYVNLNQGAESTISYLLARLAVDANS